MKITIEARTIISAVLAAIFAGLLFASYAMRLGEGATGAFGAALTLCLASPVGGAAAMRRIRRDSKSEHPPAGDTDGT